MVAGPPLIDRGDANQIGCFVQGEVDDQRCDAQASGHSNVRRLMRIPSSSGVP